MAATVRVERYEEGFTTYAPRAAARPATVTWYPAAGAPRAAVAAPGNAKQLACALAAPFVTLAFVVGFPFVGLAALAWVALRALKENPGRAARFVRNVVLFLAAPFVGLAYAVALPFVGLGMLAWMALRPAPEAARG